MCGIAGYLGLGNEDLAAMAGRFDASLRHRGPDDGGCELISVGGGRSLLMVHRRLAIIDLSPLGHQPMKDEANRNCLVFNGEIFNFKGLRAELVKRGAVFRSHCDTEVLLRGWAEFGRALLDRLCGMFAFAMWDHVNRQLVLAVDPLGVKPLYYWQGTHGEFAFASEIRALLASGIVARQIDPVGLESYLGYGAVQRPRTIIQGIRQLAPGSFLVVSADGEVIGPHFYWEPAFPGETAGDAGEAGPPERLEEIRGLLEEVVEEHLISDVPLGVFLSGGIDSSSIVAMAARRVPGLRTFSVGFADAEFSEASYSREVARLNGTEHTELTLSEREMLDLLPGALAALDQPTFDGTNVYVISRAVRAAGLTVALSGQGGDEVFGGYSSFTRAPFVHQWRRRLAMVPRVGWRAAAALMAVIEGRVSALPAKASQLFSSEPDLLDIYLVLRQNFAPAARRALFPGGGEGCTLQALPEELDAELRSRMTGLDPVNQVSLLELRTYLSNMLLRDGDVTSMAHALEVRVPFLDRRIVDLIARIPGAAKMDRTVKKPLLVRALNGRIPETVYRRPKQGFTLPWAKWMRNELRKLGEEAINDRDTYADLGIDADAVGGVWRAFQDNRPGVTWPRVWSLIVLREWAVRNLAAQAQ